MKKNVTQNGRSHFKKWTVMKINVSLHNFEHFITFKNFHAEKQK